MKARTALSALCMLLAIFVAISVRTLAGSVAYNESQSIIQELSEGAENLKRLSDRAVRWMNRASADEAHRTYSKTGTTPVTEFASEESTFSLIFSSHKKDLQDLAAGLTQSERGEILGQLSKMERELRQVSAQFKATLHKSIERQLDAERKPSAVTERPSDEWCGTYPEIKMTMDQKGSCWGRLPGQANGPAYRPSLTDKPQTGIGLGGQDSFNQKAKN